MTCDANATPDGCHKRLATDQTPDNFPVDDHEANVQRILADRTLLLRDPANLCTFSNCIIGFWVLASICKEKFYLGMALMMLGNILDIVDGRIALETPNRHPIVKEFGRMLDPIVEALMANMAPAFVLMRLGDFHIIPVCIAAFFIVVGNFRTGKYFVVGHIKEEDRIYYPGMWAEYNLCLCGILGLSMPFVKKQTMAIMWTLMLFFLCYGMLTTRVRSYRYNGKDLKVVVAFCASLCFSYTLLFLKYGASIFTGHSLILEFSLFFIHLVLAYPCLFKHIEIQKKQ